MSDDVLISEVFGPTLQGEGPSVGRRAGFVRFGLCNLNCSWCDAAYTWDWTRFDRKVELARLTVPEIVDHLGVMGVDLVVITGGEPLVQRRHLGDLISALAGYEIEIETNGTLSPAGLPTVGVSFNVSPKLPHSGVDPTKAIHLAHLREYRDLGARFKFVCQNDGDLDQIDRLIDAVQITPPSIWIMAEGIAPDIIWERQRLLIDGVLRRGWNMTPRLHIDLWGAERGH